MKKTAIKALSLLLALVFLLSMAVSCSKTDEEETDTESVTTVTGEDAPRYDENGYLMDDLPETWAWNETFTVYSWSNMKQWEWVEEVATDSSNVDRVLWKRMINVETRFGVDMQFVYEVGDWDNRKTFISKLMNSVLAGAQEYDLVDQYTPCAATGALNGVYLDLGDVSYIDLEKPWWPATIVDTATVGDSLYFVTGDITATLIRNIHCTFLNLDLYESYKLSDAVGGKNIYDLVYDYEWTYENMKKMALGKVDTEQGYYGLTVQSNTNADSFFYGGGFMTAENVNGKFTLSQTLTDQSLYNYFEEIRALFSGQHADFAVDGLKAFKNGKSLFCVGSTASAGTFLQGGVRFTILPMPLRDSSQETYNSCASYWVSMFSVPIDAKNVEMSGMILEGLGSESYRTCTDEIYYDLFQMRYNADSEDSSKMFDIVSDGVLFDSGRIFADDIKVYSAFRNGVTSTDKTVGWSSIYNTNIAAWESSIAGVVAALEKNT